LAATLLVRVLASPPEWVLGALAFGLPVRYALFLGLGLPLHRSHSPCSLLGYSADPLDRLVPYTSTVPRVVAPSPCPDVRPVARPPSGGFLLVFGVFPSFPTSPVVSSTSKASLPCVFQVPKTPLFGFLCFPLPCGFTSSWFFGYFSGSPGRRCASERSTTRSYLSNVPVSSLEGSWFPSPVGGFPTSAS
jgi:hypothetical protein